MHYTIDITLIYTRYVLSISNTTNAAMGCRGYVSVR